MAYGFEIDVGDQVDNAAKYLSGLESRLDIVSGRALKKVAKWLAVHSLREIGKELEIKQQPLKRRFKVYPGGDKEVKLWVGIFPIAVHHLGSVKKTPDGVRVGRRRYGGAFMASAGGGSEMVWRRKGRERLPVERVTEDISDPVRDALQRWESRVSKKFADILQHEINFELNK